jgi:hypothetical protein
MLHIPLIAIFLVSGSAAQAVTLVDPQGILEIADAFLGMPADYRENMRYGDAFALQRSWYLPLVGKVTCSQYDLATYPSDWGYMSIHGQETQDLDCLWMTEPSEEHAATLRLSGPYRTNSGTGTAPDADTSDYKVYRGNQLREVAANPYDKSLERTELLDFAIHPVALEDGRILETISVRGIRKFVYDPSEIEFTAVLGRGLPFYAQLLSLRNSAAPGAGILLWSKIVSLKLVP